MTTVIGSPAVVRVAALSLGMALAGAGTTPTADRNGAGAPADPGLPGIPSSEPQADPSDAIRAVLGAQQADWNRGDLSGFLEGYWNSPQLTFAGSEGIVRGYGGLLERYRKTYPDKPTMGELEFSGLEVETLCGDAALVRGHWHLRRSKGDAGGVFTLIFRRFPTGWRIVHDHTSAQNVTP
jgi:ketosteroid isomerase-like protein